MGKERRAKPSCHRRVCPSSRTSSHGTNTRQRWTEWRTKPHTGGSGWWKARCKHIPKISWGLVRLRQTVGAAERDPHGACWVSLGGGRSESSVRQNSKQLFTHKPPFPAVLQIHNWLVGPSQGEAGHCTLSKTRWDQWPAAAPFPDHQADTDNENWH